MKRLLGLALCYKCFSLEQKYVGVLFEYFLPPNIGKLMFVVIIRTWTKNIYTIEKEPEHIIVTRIALKMENN